MPTSRPAASGPRRRSQRGTWIKGIGLARRGDVDDGLVWMAEALEQAPAERPEVGRMLRANLAGWEGQMPRRRAFLEHAPAPTSISPRSAPTAG